MPASEIHVMAPEVVFPTSVKEALAILDGHPGDAKIVGGATWLMRAGLRGDKLPTILVSLARVEHFTSISEQSKGWTIGPMVTHEDLARRFGTATPLRALGQAAGLSANPGVRRLATLGGNIATESFAAADLVPALVALDASLTVADSNGTIRFSVEDFLHGRSYRSEACIITGIEIEDTGYLSAHARQTMRQAGEYPVAIVTVAAKLSQDRRIEALRIAVGSVEPTARRWEALESQLIDQALDSAGIRAAAEANLGVFTPREGVDAPSWYRLEILPHLVCASFAEIGKQVQG